MNNDTRNFTPAEIERLVMLIEEAGEVIQAATKVLRFGWQGTYDNGVTNRERLEEELIQLFSVSGIMNGNGDVFVSLSFPA